ncbi:methylated-DNA-[protein]-cysteine S-methyltransferase [Ferrimonas sediminum]|uniref:Methylated-DNA--protein-cysteine methyltransferase n=1 Tax=Ferrimonas sediminum TaxID=718193 RepID=A0A1G8KDA2_9GAMM|nr:methylated-DNA--[protein]-cysteine S-methyltransferase [Ferrimonas sediminum]SDI41407.1 methylated-DNA-[protein]-cysteine S-methyltransferase [Ferrimonas sediminum]
MKYDQWPTPWGEVVAVVSDKGLVALGFQQGAQPLTIEAHWQRCPQALQPVRTQFEEYVQGRRQRFDLPLDMRGTAFQQQVWQALVEIPYGETCAYSEIAERIERPKSVRAVGAANGRNPVAVVVPCHRVIGKDGSLTGYAGGVALKQALLEHERQD